MTAEVQEFPIKRDRVANYIYWQVLLLLCLPLTLMFCFGLVLAILWCLLLGTWLPRAQAQALRFRLDGSILRVDQGVFFLQRKAIPLDRITDIVLAQGPLLRHHGIWDLRIQTAGTGQMVPEASMIGLEEPEQVREIILQARQRLRGAGQAAS